VFASVLVAMAAGYQIGRARSIQQPGEMNMANPLQVPSGTSVPQRPEARAGSVWIDGGFWYSPAGRELTFLLCGMALLAVAVTAAFLLVRNSEQPASDSALAKFSARSCEGKAVAQMLAANHPVRNKDLSAVADECKRQNDAVAAAPEEARAAEQDRQIAARQRKALDH
jgi:hypothetical protein